MSQPSSFEPRLGPDFAQRVLRSVDLQLARRRQTRRTALAVASLCAVAAIAGLRSGWFVPTEPPASRPYREAMESQDFSLPTQDTETDALGDLFPDAAAVVSIDSQYAQSGQDGDSLFEDEVQDVQDDRTLL